MIRVCESCKELEAEVKRLKDIVHQYKTGTRGIARKKERQELWDRQVQQLFRECPGGIKTARTASWAWKCSIGAAEKRLDKMKDLGIMTFNKALHVWAWTPYFLEAQG